MLYQKSSLPLRSVWASTSRLSFLLLCFLVASSSSAVVDDVDEMVTFSLHDNGSSDAGLEVTLRRSEFYAPPESFIKEKDGRGEKPPFASEVFASRMSNKIEVSKYQAPQPVMATRAYREDGELIERFDQLKPLTIADDESGTQQEQLRRIYLVAEDLEFIWPYIEFGHKQTVSTNVVPPVGGKPVVLESVSETPRVFRVWNMATTEESEAIIDRALNATGNDALKRSTVGSGTDDEGNELKKEDFGRTSENAWDWSSPAAKVMIKRSFQLTNVEENDGKRDGLQVVRYNPGQGYNTHPDYFTPEKKRYQDADFDFHPYSGGSNRFATVFMYLNNPEEGGATAFPYASNQDPNAANLPTYPPQQSSEMFQKGTWEYNVNNDCYNPSKVAVKPIQGTAALFYSITPDGRIDSSSHHAACPLLDGTKWGANIWIWNKQRFGDLRTGGARQLKINNRADETVYIVWEGKPNGELQPGRSFAMNTFEHHRFKVSFNSYKDKPFTSFTVQECEPNVVQTWDIERPRNYNQQQAQRKGGGKPNEMAVTAKNYMKEAVEILWQGQPLGVNIDAGDTVRLNTFVGHTLQATSSVANKIISTLNVHPDSDFWSIFDDEKDDHDEL